MTVLLVMFRQWISGVGVFVLISGALTITASAMTYQDNVVNMPLTAQNYTILTASYKILGFSITSGQDPDQNIKVNQVRTYSGNKGSMTFRIGRDGSTDVATWFSQQINSNQNTFGDEPGKLNFAFIGTLWITLTGGVLGDNQVTYTLENIVLAQGHTVTRNNWWFGGKFCAKQAGDVVSCTAVSPTGFKVNFSFLRGGNSVDTVELKSIDYPAFQMFSLNQDYWGESVGCPWQPAGKCPPFVTYYNQIESPALRLTVKNNLLYNSKNVPFDTSLADPSHSRPAAIFVMNGNGTVYASNANKVYLFHHSSILGGQAVASAGELVVDDGIITSMTNCSGHYRPSPVAIIQLTEALYRQGYIRTFRTDKCSPDMLRY